MTSAPTPTIPLNRTVKSRVEVLRRGQWIDVSRFVARVEVNHGDHSGVGVNPSGADGVARTATITLKSHGSMRRYWPSTLSRLSDDLLGMSDERIAWSNEDATAILDWMFGPSAGWTRENLAPRDRTSAVNMVQEGNNLVYDPLLWAGREIRVWGRTLAGLTPQEPVVINGDGTTAEFTLPHTLIEPATVRVVTHGTAPLSWEIDGWTGKLWLNRPLANGEKLTVDYSTYTHDDGWKCEFHGVIGADIRADGSSVTLRVVDMSIRLQQAYIFDAAEEPYSGPMEEVMQQILRDHPSTEHITLYFPSGTPANPRPSSESPEWYVEKYAPGEMSVWDALGRLAARRGWFVGYRWHEPTQQMQLQLLGPPRWKDATTADLRLSWMTDFYTHDLADSDASIINQVEVIWRDEHGEQHKTVRENPSSIGAYGLRAGRIREDETSEIRDASAAERLAEAVIADLSEMRGMSSLDMPVVPGLDVFTGVALDDPRVSSSEDFLGVENVLQVYDFERGRFRSQVSGPNRVVGGLTRWLGMIARPGAKQPTPPEGIGGGTVTMPTPTITVIEVTEGLVVEVPEPPVYPARWAATQVQVSTDPTFPAAQTLEAMDKSTRFTFDGLDGGDTYYVRAAYIDIAGRQWGFSSHVSGVPRRIQDRLPADLFDIELSSEPAPSSGELSNLLDNDPGTGCTFPSAPTITYKYPKVDGVNVAEIHLAAAATGYIQMRHPDSGAWIDVYGSAASPKAFQQGWNRPVFDGDKLYYGREYRLVLLANVRVNELRYERTVVADLILGGRMRLTGDMAIENEDGSLEMNNQGIRMTTPDGSSFLSPTGLVFEDGSGNRSGYVRGIIPGVAEDGEYVSLPFTNPPTVILTPAEAITYDPNVGGMQKLRLEATEVSPHGFRVNAKLIRRDNPGRKTTFPNDTKQSTARYSPSSGHTNWCIRPNAHSGDETEGSLWSSQRVQSVDETWTWTTIPGATGIVIRLREMLHCHAFVGNFTATNSITYSVRIRPVGSLIWQSIGPFTRSISAWSSTLSQGWNSSHTQRTYSFLGLAPAQYEVGVRIWAKSTEASGGTNTDRSCFLLIEEVDEFQETVIQTPEPIVVHYAAFEQDSSAQQSA